MLYKKGDIIKISDNSENLKYFREYYLTQYGINITIDDKFLFVEYNEFKDIAYIVPEKAPEIAPLSCFLKRITFYFPVNRDDAIIRKIKYLEDKWTNRKK